MSNGIFIKNDYLRDPVSGCGQIKQNIDEVISLILSNNSGKEELLTRENFEFRVHALPRLKRKEYSN